MPLDLGVEPKPATKYEVHEHTWISGGKSGSFSHSHEGGSTPHTHPDTGPSGYVIDKAAWLRITGVPLPPEHPVPKFTPKPTGAQLPSILRSAEENSFEIHHGAPPPDFKGQGGGMFTAARMILRFRMTVSNVIPFPGPKRASA